MSQSTTGAPATSNATPSAPAEEKKVNGQDAEQTGDDLPNATPRDVRLLHLIMASMGVESYEERVPLQLMDFAYRYTHGVLQDALLYNDHAHAQANTLPAGLGPTNSPVSIDDVRLAIAARTNYQFKSTPPKELLLELAQERNKRPLPAVAHTFGLRLPPEKYCLTSKEWEFKDEPDQIMHETVLEQKQEGGEDVEMGGV